MGIRAFFEEVLELMGINNRTTQSRSKPPPHGQNRPYAKTERKSVPDSSNLETSSAATKQEEPKIRVGQTLSHQVYGKGIVTLIENGILTVHFDDMARKFEANSLGKHLFHLPPSEEISYSIHFCCERQFSPNLPLDYFRSGAIKGEWLVKGHTILITPELWWVDNGKATFSVVKSWPDVTTVEEVTLPCGEAFTSSGQVLFARWFQPWWLSLKR